MLAEQWELWFPDAYEIGSESVRSFARATRTWHVPYATSSRVPNGTAVPAMMIGSAVLQSAAAVVGKAIPGCNLSSILHAGQSFTYLRPLRIGDVLSVGARMTAHAVKADTDLITVECMVYEGGEPALGAEVFIAHSQRSVGIDPAATDRLADQIMMLGTGPSNSDAYTASIANSPG